MTEIEKSLVGKKVIVRANVAGVHAGEVVLADFSSNTVQLKNARRLWGYQTRDQTGSVSDIAANGLRNDKEHSIGAVIPRVTIPNRDGLEIAEMTNEAWESVFNYE